jgi:hypothetical protein
MSAPAVIGIPSTLPCQPIASDARLVRVDDWSSTIGGEVYVVQYGRVVRFGTVELTTDDNQIAWIAPSGAEVRQLVSKGEDHEFWIAPRQLQQAHVRGEQ